MASPNITSAYNLNGSLQPLTYPSGRVVNFAYDAASTPLSAIGPAGVQHASAATYATQKLEKEKMTSYVGYGSKFH